MYMHISYVCIYTLYMCVYIILYVCVCVCIHLWLSNWNNQWTLLSSLPTQQNLPANNNEVISGLFLSQCGKFRRIGKKGKNHRSFLLYLHFPMMHEGKLGLCFQASILLAPGKTLVNLSGLHSDGSGIVSLWLRKEGPIVSSLSPKAYIKQVMFGSVSGQWLNMSMSS